MVQHVHDDQGVRICQEFRLHLLRWGHLLTVGENYDFVIHDGLHIAVEGGDTSLMPG